MTNQVLESAGLVGTKICGGRYKILSRLGTGSMGHVYRAYDNRLESDVVIKIPTPERLENQEFRARFSRETSLLVRLTHPHVVKVIDIGDINDIPFVVMQYLSGGTLRDRISGPGNKLHPLDASSLNDWLREIAKALDFVHDQNTVHRDVKPTNIIFDEYGNAYLADFGLTKIIYGDITSEGNDDTAAGFVIGTPNYIAPELVLGQDYNGKADQYSLALTIYEVLSGTIPMQGKTASATMVNQTRLVPKPLAEVRSDIPPQVSAAVAKALSKDPQQRFTNCTQFAEAILNTVKSSASSQPAARKGSTDRMQMRDTSVTRTQKPARQRPQPAYETHNADFDHPNAVSQQSVPAARQPLVGKVSKGRPGLVNCPRCQNALPLDPRHAGLTGRCIHCNIRLRIGDNAASLKVIPNAKRTMTRSGKVRKPSEELAIGEKVFGFQMSRKAATLLVILLLGIILAAAVGLTLFTAKPEQKPKTRSMESASLHLPNTTTSHV
jgi:serine/threonine-protein kinase